MAFVLDDVEEAPVTYKASKYHFDGLDPDVRDRFINLSKEYYDMFGEPLTMRSGYRSTEHQAKLYAKDPKSGYVAKPGGSVHEKGRAIDLDKKQVAKMPEGMIEKYFNRPLMGQTASGVVEPWHVEHPEARENPIFDTRTSVLERLGNLLSPSSAHAAEGPSVGGFKLDPEPEPGGGGFKLDPEPGSMPGRGWLGHLLSGTRKGLGHTAGKVMAEAAEAAGPAHGYFPAPGTGDEIVKQRTPEYDLSQAGEIDQFFFGGGEAIGHLPEYIWRGLPGGAVGGLGGGFTTKLLARMAASSIPFAQAVGVEPDVTEREVAAAGGAGAVLPLLRPLPWYGRAAGGFGVGAGQTLASHPDAGIGDIARGGTLMGLMSMIHGRGKLPPRPAPPTPEVKAPAPAPAVEPYYPPPHRGKVVSYGPNTVTYYGRGGEPLVLDLNVTKYPKGYGEIAQRLAELNRISGQRGPATVEPTRPPIDVRVRPEMIQGTPESLPIIEPSIIQKPGQSRPRPGGVTYSDQGKAMRPGPAPASPMDMFFELADLDRRIAIRYTGEAPPRGAVDTPLVPRDAGLGVTTRGVSTAVRPQPSEPGRMVPREPGDFRPGGVVVLDSKGKPVTLRGAPEPVPAPVAATPPAALSKQQLFKLAKDAKTFDEFNKAVGSGTLPEGLTNLQDFYNQVKGGKPGAVKKAAQSEDITKSTPINEISYDSFVDILAKSEVVRDAKGKVTGVNNNWATVTNELQQASQRFDNLTFAHHFNPVNLLGRLSEKIKSIAGVDDAVAFKSAKEIMKGYSDNAWKPFNSATGQVQVQAPAPISGLLPPEGKPPTLVGMTAPRVGTGVHSEFHLRPDLETPNTFRLVREDYAGATEAARPSAIATGTLNDITRFMRTTSDTAWKESGKFGEAFKVTQAGEGGVKMYSGGPDTSAALKKLQGILKPYTDAYKARMTGEWSEGALTDFLAGAKDINRFMQFARLPFWVGKQNPTFGKVTQVSDLRIEQFNHLKNNWIREFKDFFYTDLPPERMRLLDRHIAEGDRIGSSYLNKTPEQLKETLVAHRAKVKGEGEDIYNAYMSHRRGYDRVWDDLELQFERMGIPPSEVSALRQEMGFYPEYAPRTWAKGKYYVVGKDHLTGEPVERYAARTKAEGNRVAAEFEAKYGKGNVDVGKNVRLPDEVFDRLRPESTVRLLDESVKRAKTELPPADREAILREISDSFKVRGAMERFTKRGGVEGYRTEGYREIAHEYMNGMAGFMAKLEAAPKYLEALGGVSNRKTPNLYEYGRKYVRDVMANTSSFDQALGTWRALMFHQFLGLSVRAASVNLTQNWVAFAPWMAKEGMAMPEVKMAIGMKDVLSNWGSFRALLRGEDPKFGGKVEPVEGAALAKIFQSGAFNDYATAEMAGQIHGKGYGALTQVAEASRSVFGTAESLNRVASGLTAFRYYFGKLVKEGADQEVAFGKAVKQAHDAVMSTHYLMGTFNLPEVARGSKAGSMFRASGYQFKGFTHNYIEMLAHLFQENPKAALRSMGIMAAVAGPIAMPVVNEAFHMYKWATGTDPLEDAFENKDQNPLYTALKYGLPGFLEADLSSSAGAQVVQPDEPLEMAINTLLGPLGSIVLKSAPQAAELYGRGAGARSLEPLAPTAIKNMMKAYRESTEGVTTSRGQAVLDDKTGEPVKLSTREGVQQSFGFRPTSAATRSAQVENLRRRQQGRSDAQARWASQYVRALRAEDEQAADRILNEVTAYNDWAAERGEPPVRLADLVRDIIQPKSTTKSWRQFMQERQ